MKGRVGDGTCLFNVHYLARYAAVENVAIDYVGCYIDAVDAVLADIAGGVDELAQVGLAVFDGDEADKVRPGHD